MTFAAAFALAADTRSGAQARAEMVDTALVLAVDVSGSVTDERYALQMEGIARAFEDTSVQAAILSGAHRAIFVTLVEWSNRPAVSVPWTLIAVSFGPAKLRPTNRVINSAATGCAGCPPAVGRADNR